MFFYIENGSLQVDPQDRRGGGEAACGSGRDQRHGCGAADLQAGVERPSLKGQDIWLT